VAGPTGCVVGARFLDQAPGVREVSSSGGDNRQGGGEVAGAGQVVGAAVSISQGLKVFLEPG
jgi:hypothetical protein